MSLFVKSYRAGAALLSPYAPSQELSMHGSEYRYCESNRNEWYSHFDNAVMSARGDIPRPFMLDGKPVLEGGDYCRCAGSIFSRVFIDLDESIYFVETGFGDRYELVENFGKKKEIEVREPNNAEYEKHFKEGYDNELFKLKTSKHPVKVFEEPWKIIIFSFPYIQKKEKKGRKGANND